jgi:hypothetical protein
MAVSIERSVGYGCGARDHHPPDGRRAALTPIAGSEVSTTLEPGSASRSALGGRERTRMPAGLRSEAADRVAWMALFMAVLFVAIEALQQVAQPQLAPILGDLTNRLLALAVVVSGVGLFLARRYRLIATSAILVGGMAFEVLVAFGIAMVETAWPILPGQPVLGTSWLGPWIVAVGVIVPNRPIWTLLTALIAATAWPVAYAINYARLDLTLPPLGTLAAWPTLNYLLAGLAYALARRWYSTACDAQLAVVLGSYRLVSRIGAGGMGEVWKATHHMLARSAAVKLIKPHDGRGAAGRDRDLALKRFKREANVIARLQSPHTVYLYDYGTSRDGRAYYAMELLDGISLQELVATFGPQPASRVVNILRQMCQSLEEAHQRLLVHRDLKPSNIMLCKIALEYDFVKVLDFGLAKFVERAGTTQLTMDGVQGGTPGYMAPEVVTGAPGDARADLYALGCVGYFLLTGTRVFEDANPITVALKHVQAVPVPPSQRTELPIPRPLEALILDCLEKNPAARPESARGIASRLAACGIDAWTCDDADHWWERHLPSSSALRATAAAPEHTPGIVRKT